MEGVAAAMACPVVAAAAVPWRLQSHSPLLAVQFQSPELGAADTCAVEEGAVVGEVT